MKRVNVDIYPGAVFDGGYVPLSYDVGLTYAWSNKLFVGDFKYLSHELMEWSLMRKFPDIEDYHCETAGCMLNNFGGYEVDERRLCDYHSDLLIPLRHIPFELAINFYDNGISFPERDLDKYLKELNNIADMNATVANIKTVDEEFAGKYVVMSRKFCGLAPRFKKAHDQHTYQIFPEEFIMQFDDLCKEAILAKEHEYALPHPEYGIMPVSINFLDAFFSACMDNGLMCIEDIRAKRKVVNSWASYYGAYYDLLEMGFISFRDNDGPIPKKRSMEETMIEVNSLKNTIEFFDSLIYGD